MVRSRRKMTRASGKGRQVHPKGGVITVGPDERLEFRVQREKLKLRQEDLALKVGVSPATISNLETGRHPQIKKDVYAKIRRVLHLAAAGRDGEDSDEAFRAIVAGVIDLDEGGQRVVAALIESLKKSGHSGSGE